MTTEYVRVEDPDTGHLLTLDRQYAENYGFRIHEDRPAVDVMGRPLPATHRKTKAGEPAPKAADPAKKEN